MNVVLDTHLPGIPKRQGKVRDVYDFGEKLLIVATDRISAYDWVMPNGIPDKGRILTQLSLFWFDFWEIAITCCRPIRPRFPCQREPTSPRWKAGAWWCEKPKSFPWNAWCVAI